MEKPRILIADTDVNYIIPLQLKFVEDFFEKVDLEIIIDETYFNELFSTPQQIDILIISEALYTQSLLRHNITHVFLMTENQEEDVTSALNVNCIFKYTSIKEIFNEIIGKSEKLFDVKRSRKKETEIILLYSANGGVGKTTVAMGVSACLTQNYKRVLYINANHLQTFQRWLKNQTTISSTEIYEKLTNKNENAYEAIKHMIRKEQFQYVPPFKAALMSVGLDYSVYERIAIDAKQSKDFDYIIIDTDTVFDEEKAKLLHVADKVLIITEQTDASVYATNVLVSNINGMNNDKYVFICNNYNKEKENALIYPSVSLKFTVSDYIDHFQHYNQMGCEALGKDNGMQRIAFLIM